MPRRSTHLRRSRSTRRSSIRVERLEPRYLLAADVAPLHNAFDPVDMNDDGTLSSTDALVVINELNNSRSRSRSHFVDVNADGNRSPSDLLMVINQIARGGGRDRGRGNDSVGVPARSAAPRSFDGTGNNLANPELGSVGEQLLRVASVEYSDGTSSLAGADRPSARAISNALADHIDDPLPNQRQLSAFLYVWGQFLDHDLALTTNQASGGESAGIVVPTGDSSFDPDATGNQVIPFTRSNFAAGTGTDVANPRQQISDITAWIDGSMVYGSDDETAASLREFAGGRLLIEHDGLLPTDDSGSFIAGDIRSNENVELTSMHTLFVREHNYLASKIAAQRPDLSDEELFQRARALVIAEIQAITYNEFLPALLGQQVLPRYTGYDAGINPTVANEFSTAAFRFGHSALNDDVEFFGDDGRAVRDEVGLREAFFNPALLQETGIDSILKYVASTQSEEIDLQIVDSVRNFLFGEPGQGGLDLASLNIQRGRDHGLADYNSVREAYGLSRVANFAEITTDPAVQQSLADLYGSVDNIDLWIGGLAEDHVAGSSVGPTFQRIIADQFQRLRDGDRLWYQTAFSGSDLRQIERTRLADILRRNTTITNLQDNVFLFHAEVQGTVFVDTNADGTLGRRETGVAGITVELLDDKGVLLATTVTDRRGRYRFNDFHETGDYQVRIVRPSAAQAIGAATRDILISRGNERVRNVNFGLTLSDRRAVGIALLTGE